MSNRFRAALLCLFFGVMLVSAPWMWPQEVNDKTASDKSTSEQRTEEKRPGRPCEVTTCAAKSLYLSNLSQPNELQDLVNTLRTIGEISRVQQLPFERLVIVRGTPEQLAFAEKIADEIDNAKYRFGGMGYRLDFKVSESEGNKKLRSRVYSLVTEAGDSARLDIGRRAAVQGQSDLSSENKRSADTFAGRGIECRVVAENERTIDLHVDTAFSSSGSNGTGSADPTEFRLKNRATVALGEPTVLGVVDDPNSERTFQIEVTATRIKERR